MSEDTTLKECMNILRNLSIEAELNNQFALHHALEYVRDRLDDYSPSCWKKRTLADRAGQDDDNRLNELITKDVKGQTDV